MTDSIRAPAWQRLSAGAAENISPGITLCRSERKSCIFLSYLDSNLPTHACRKQDSAGAAADNFRGCKTGAKYLPKRCCHSDQLIITQADETATERAEAYDGS